MSYLGLNPAQLGVLIPQDPLTGLPRIDELIVFDLLMSVDYQSQGQVARHPIQSGKEGPADSILDETERCSIQACFVDKPFTTGLIPLPLPFSQPDRCLLQAQALADLKARRQLVTAVVPGRILADRAISMLMTTPSPDGAEVSVSMILEHVRVVSLSFLPVVADADSMALGSQTTEKGYG